MIFVTRWEIQRSSHLILSPSKQASFGFFWLFMLDDRRNPAILQDNFVAWVDFEGIKMYFSKAIEAAVKCPDLLENCIRISKKIYLIISRCLLPPFFKML